MIDFDATVLAAADAAFGDTVTWYPAWGSPALITGIFTERFHETTFQDATEIVEERPVLNARAVHFVRPPVQGELLRIRGVLHAITEVLPDGMGDLRLYLRAASDAEAAKAMPPASP